MSLEANALADTRPIELVTFDLYDTLIELHPPRWERFHAALAKLGVRVDLEAIRLADVIAEDFFTLENGKVPIRDRPKAQREAFRLAFLTQVPLWLVGGFFIAFERKRTRIRLGLDQPRMRRPR